MLHRTDLTSRLPIAQEEEEHWEGKLGSVMEAALAVHDHSQGPADERAESRFENGKQAALAMHDHVQHPATNPGMIATDEHQGSKHGRGKQALAMHDHLQHPASSPGVTATDEHQGSKHGRGKQALAMHDHLQHPASSPGVTATDEHQDSKHGRGKQATLAVHDHFQHPASTPRVNATDEHQGSKHGCGKEAARVVHGHADHAASSARAISAVECTSNCLPALKRIKLSPEQQHARSPGPSYQPGDAGESDSQHQLLGQRHAPSLGQSNQSCPADLQRPLPGKQHATSLRHSDHPHQAEVQRPAVEKASGSAASCSLQGIPAVYRPSDYVSENLPCCGPTTKTSQGDLHAAGLANRVQNNAAAVPGVLCISFGSVGEMGLLGDPVPLAQLLLATLQMLQQPAIVLTGVLISVLQSRSGSDPAYSFQVA